MNTTYYDGIKKVTAQGNWVVYRHFTKPYPTIVRNPDGTHSDRGGRMSKEWWAGDRKVTSVGME